MLKIIQQYLNVKAKRFRELPSCVPTENTIPHFIILENPSLVKLCTTTAAHNDEHYFMVLMSGVDVSVVSLHLVCLYFVAQVIPAVAPGLEDGGVRRKTCSQADNTKHTQSEQSPKRESILSLYRA